MTTPSAGHLDPEVMAAFAEGVLAPLEADGVRLHLAGCPGCRREFVEVGRMLAASPAARPRPVPVWAAAAAGKDRYFTWSSDVMVEPNSTLPLHITLSPRY